jgi:hypothetical protein
MHEAANHVDLNALPGRLRMLAVYACIALVVSGIWWFALPVLQRAGALGWIESVLLWAFPISLVVATLLSISSRFRQQVNTSFSSLVLWYLFVTTSHFILLAVQTDQVHSITHCCGYSRWISAIQEPLIFWMYFALWIVLWLASAISLAALFVLKPVDKR